MKKLILFSTMLLFQANLIAQGVQNIISETSDNFAKDDQTEIEDEIPIELQRLTDHPIDINSEEIELLLQLNVITQKQFEALKNHIYHFGKLIALQELQVIDEFDIQTIRSILPYIEITGRSVADEESQSFIFRFQQQVKDYIPADFQGDPTKITLKYRGNTNGNVSYGLLAEKDPGEKIIFGSGKAGFDFYSLFLQIKLSGNLNKIIIGDYSVSYGQGLTAWSGTGFSSNENIISLCKSGRGISPSASTDENRYLRGVAIESNWNKFIIGFWLSSHKIDGNIEIDSTTGYEYIRSFLTSGYHRSQNENSGYHIVRESYFGTNIKYELRGWKVGITSAYNLFSIPIIKKLEDYNKFDFRGKSNFNFGFDYSKNIRNLLLFGEVSTCKNGAIAYINGLLISAGKNLSLSIVHHKYNKDYHSLKSNAFGSNTNPSNENGIYVGMNMKLNRAIAITAYLNQDMFPYLKFRIDLPSNSTTQGILLNYIPSKKLSMQMRYRNKSRQLNNSESYEGIRNLNDVEIQNLRFSISLLINDSWDYRSKVEIGGKKINTKLISKGYIYCQDLFFHSAKKKLSGNIRYAIYYSPDFDLRFYEYENDLPGAFSIPFYYGNGSKFYVNLNYKIKNITVSGKFSRAWTIYDDDLLGETKIIDEAKIQVRISL